MINVNDYKSNIFSQNGEDGIVEFLLTRITQDHFVIEFGAADGFFYSNTAALWHPGKYDALLIESERELFDKLYTETFDNTRVTAEHALVTNIDDHTTRVADVCSIDVDGNDWHIAERMQTKHKIVIVEFNPTIPAHVEMIGAENESMGSSALSITRLMTSKGYTLVAGTKTNLFFLLGDHSDEFVSDLDVLFDRSSLNYVVTAYDGRYDMIGEFGYGFSSPANLSLRGRTGEQRKTADAVTTEFMRQITQWTEDKRVQDKNW